MAAYRMILQQHMIYVIVVIVQHSTAAFILPLHLDPFRVGKVDEKVSGKSLLHLPTYMVSELHIPEIGRAHV